MLHRRTIIFFSFKKGPNISLHVETQNHINSLKYFSVFLLNCKIRHASTTWKDLVRKSQCLPIFWNITEIMKTIKSLYDLWGRCHKITDVCVDLQPCFTSHNLIPVLEHLVKQPISPWPFFVCQFIDYFKFETRPSFLRNSEIANH